MRRYTRATIMTGILVGGVVIGATAAQQVPRHRVLRTIVLPGQAYNVVIDEPARRAVVIGIDNAMGYASTLDTVTGDLVRTVALTSGSNPTDVAVDERTSRVFITDGGVGIVSVLDAQSGALLRTVTVGEMQPGDLQRIAVDAGMDHVFVSSSPVTRPDPTRSAVHMLDARTGAELRTAMTGGGSLAVDDRSGRVFVANLTGNSVSMLDGQSDRAHARDHSGRRHRGDPHGRGWADRPGLRGDGRGLARYRRAHRARAARHPPPRCPQ